MECIVDGTIQADDETEAEMITTFRKYQKLLYAYCRYDESNSCWPEIISYYPEYKKEKTLIAKFREMKDYCWPVIKYFQTKFEPSTSILFWKLIEGHLSWNPSWYYGYPSGQTDRDNEEPILCQKCQNSCLTD